MSAEILAALKRIEAKVDALMKKPAQAAPSGEVAADADLDSQYGNPKVKCDPRDWSGATYKGFRFSECPPEYLDMVANLYDFFAQKNAAADPKKAGYDRKDAARARGWAARKRNGWKPTEAPAQPASGGDYDFDSSDPSQDIPF